MTTLSVIANYSCRHHDAITRSHQARLTKATRKTECTKRFGRCHRTNLQKKGRGKKFSTTSFLFAPPLSHTHIHTPRAHGPNTSSNHMDHGSNISRMRHTEQCKPLQPNHHRFLHPPRHTAVKEASATQQTCTKGPQKT